MKIILIFIFINIFYVFNPSERRYIDKAIQLESEFILADYELFMSQSLSTDDSGNIVFFDRGLAQIVYLDPHTKTFDFFGGGKGRGPREFQSIWDLEIDTNGDIYLTDMQKQKFLHWNIDGNYKGEYQAKGRFVQPARLTLCKEKRLLYVLSAQYGPSGYIHQYNLKGEHLNTFQKVKDRLQRLPFYTDGALTCDQEGNLYYAGMYTNFIKKYDINGKLIYDKEIFDFEKNENITVENGRFFDLNEDVRRASGEIYYMDGKLAVAFSGRKDNSLISIDIYTAETATYEYSIEMPSHFESFVITKDRIITFEEDENGEDILRIYSYNGV